MTQGISLIVGLGNPGPEYTQTRHNAGFRFLDELLSGSDQRLRAEPKFSANSARLACGPKQVWLLQPMSFMNHSGAAVAKCSQYYKIPADEILVVHDELDLPPGTVRLKLGGGDGGHKGLSDITARLGSSHYARLRIGIGHPGSSSQVLSYVLKKAPLAEETLIEAAIKTAAAHILDIVHGHYQRVMNVLHTHHL